MLYNFSRPEPAHLREPDLGGTILFRRLSLTVAGQPFVQVYLPGQHHQLLQVKVHHPGFGELRLQVLLLLLHRRLLSVGLRLGLPATQRGGGGGLKWRRGNRSCSMSGEDGVKGGGRNLPRSSTSCGCETKPTGFSRSANRKSPVSLMTPIMFLGKQKLSQDPTPNRKQHGVGGGHHASFPTSSRRSAVHGRL